MKKALKAFLWVLLVLGVFVVLSLAILPTWVSTESGKNTTVKWVNQLLPGELSVDHIQLNWFGNQKIDNFQYKDIHGDTTLSFDHFETNTSLFYILIGGNKWNNTQLISPFIQFEEKEEKIEKKKHKFPFKFPNFKKLTVEKGNLIFVSDKLTPITISEIEIIKEHKPDIFHIKALSKRDRLTGEINISGSFDPQLHLLADIKNFPVIILDQLTETSFYTKVLGETITIHADAKKEPNQTKIDAKISSSNINGDLRGHTKGNDFIIDPTSSLYFILTPALFQEILPQKEWTLANKPLLTLNVQEGSFPLKKTPNLNNFHIKGAGSLERAELSHHDLGPYSLSNFTISVDVDQKLNIHYTGDLLGKEKANLSGDVTIERNGDVKFATQFKGFPYSLLSLLSVKEGESLKNIFSENIDLTIDGSYENKKTDINIHLNTLGLQASGHIYGPSPENLKFSCEGEKQVPGKVGKFLAKNLQFNLEGIASYSEDSFSIPLVSGKLFNPYLEIDLKGNLGEKGEPFSFAKSNFTASGNISNLPIQEQNFHATIRDGSFSMNAEGAKNLVTGKAQMVAAMDSNGSTIKSKSLEVQFDVKNLISDLGDIDFESANMSFQATLDKFPVPILSAFVPEEINLSGLIGPVIDLKAAGTYTPQKEPHVELDVDAASDGFRARFSIAVDETLNIRQPKPGFMTWELTPKRYQHLMDIVEPVDKGSHFSLMETATIEVKLTQFTCPATLPEKVSTFLCQSGFNGTIESTPLFLKDHVTQENFSIQNLRGEIVGENFSQAIHLNLGGNILSPDIPKEENAGFAFQGNMLNFWNPEGKFNREHLTVDGELSLELLPVIPLTEIIPIDSETKSILRAVLGPLVNARITGQISQMSGPLTIDVKASNFKAVLPVQLSPNGITLRELVEAEITLTEAVSETLLADINPLFITGAYSSHPLKLYIYPDDFFIPIRPYSFHGVRIGKAVFDIGKIQVRNGGELQALTQFLKAKEVTPDGMMTAWFSPIIFSLNHGVSSYKRFDILLAEHFHIALWGDINLISNQVNMTLGIAPSTLKRRFRISGLSKKEMFQVQMRGTTSHLDLDWSSAHTRIGILVASSAGGHIGYLIGGIIEQIVTALGDEVTPPPTTPLPWETHSN